MDSIINIVKDLGVNTKRNIQNDDLFGDRLNHRYTTAVILVFTVVVTAMVYGGNPINCWVPGHFTGNYATYAENICWVSSTYNVPLNEDLPGEESERKVKMLKYYQWTPFILLFQAMLFYFPRMVWQSFSDKSGLDIQSIVESVVDYQRDITQQADRKKMLDYLTNSFDHFVSSMNGDEHRRLTHYVNRGGNNGNGNQNSAAPHLHRRNKNKNRKDSMENDEFDDEKSELYAEQHQPQNMGGKNDNLFQRLYRSMCLQKGKRYGNYLLCLFVFVKLLYTFNSLCQLFLLNFFLGNDYLLLGVEVLQKIWSGDDWTQLQRFPRVTMCDFRIREVGIVHRYSVQCVLSINLFNEKIFIFLWFWIFLVSLFNVGHLFSWTYALAVNGHERHNYVKRRLTALHPSTDTNGSSNGLGCTANPDYYFDLDHDPHEKRLFKRFVNHYLREDGVLALRLLSRNSQDLIVSELVANLFNLYKRQQAAIKKQLHQQQSQQLRPLFQDQTYQSRGQQQQQQQPPLAAVDVIVDNHNPTDGNGLASKA